MVCVLEQVVSILLGLSFHISKMGVKLYISYKGILSPNGSALLRHMEITDGRHNTRVEYDCPTRGCYNKQILTAGNSL